MSWEIVLLGVLIFLITGIAVWNMKKTRRSEFASFGSGPAVDTDILASKIAKAIGQEIREVLKEFKEELKYLPVAQRVSRTHGAIDDISMDESIIPTNVAVSVQGTNLDKASSEEKVVDKSLRESKSKLAGLLKNRKKKE